MGTVKVVSQVKYGRKFNYPANETAKQFCLLIPRSGRENDFAKSLTDRQLEIIKGLGFEVEQTVEVMKRARGKRD